MRKSSNLILRNDQAISSSAEDRFGWGAAVDRLAEWIEFVNPDDRMVIGIHGPWGSGKSSFLNLVEERLRKGEQQAEESKEDRNDLLVFRFQPWLFSGSQEFVVSFCCELSEFLRNSTGAGGVTDRGIEHVAGLIAKYGQTLSKCAVAGLAPLGPVGVLGAGAASVGISFVTHWHNAKGKGAVSTQAQKKRIEALLKDYDRKIVVVIDELDRLQHAELLQVFQVMRAIADFPNVVYLLGYEHDVVVKSLAKAQFGDPEEYLEKIVNFSMRVPLVPRSKMGELLAEVLSKSALFGDHGAQDDERVNELTRAYLYPNCKDLRDLKRFENNLRWQVLGLRHEIDAGDLLLVAMLQTFSLRMFEALSEIYAEMMFRKSMQFALLSEDEKKCRVSTFREKLFSESGQEKWQSVICSELFPSLFGGTLFDSDAPQNLTRIDDPRNLLRLLEYLDQDPEVLSNRRAQEWMQRCASFEGIQGVMTNATMDLRQQFLRAAQAGLIDACSVEAKLHFVKWILVCADADADLGFVRLVKSLFWVIFRELGSEQRMIAILEECIGTEISARNLQMSLLEEIMDGVHFPVTRSTELANGLRRKYIERIVTSLRCDANLDWCKYTWALIAHAKEWVGEESFVEILRAYLDVSDDVFLQRIGHNLINRAQADREIFREKVSCAWFEGRVGVLDADDPQWDEVQRETIKIAQDLYRPAS